MWLHKTWVGVLLTLCLGASVSAAQTASGTILGVVSDESGAVVPNAQVMVTNVNTGISRNLTTDGAGRYRVAGLNPGHYEIQAQAAGFQTEIRKGVQLTVGSEIEINMKLAVGQVQQTTVVEAQAPLVETTTSSLAGLVDDRTIRDLPLNGRSFDQLIALNAAAPILRLRGRTSLTGQSESFSIAGARAQSNMFIMDGTEIVGAGSITTLPGGVLGRNMGVEAVQEFKVFTSNYSSAFGKRGGGVINIATRSGTNQFHGSVFEFHRNDNLDARNFFDVDPARPLERSNPPAFRRNQFGGALGGPIRKDQTFFFGTYEGLREGLGETNTAVVPDNDARRGIIPLPDPLDRSRRIPTPVGVVPNVRPFLVLFPPVNGRNFGDGTAESISSPTRVSVQDFFLARVDHKFSDKDSLFARYNFSRASVNDPDANPLFSSNDLNRDQVLTLEEKRVISPQMLNTLRFGFLRARVFADSLPVVPLDDSLRFLPGAKTIGPLSFSPSTAGGPLTPAGTGNSAERYFVVSYFDVADQFYRYLGAHALQAGVQVQRIQHNENFQNSVRGSYEFVGLREFLMGTANVFRAPSPLAGNGDATKGYRQVYFATYLQDDYKVRPNLTLNLGLRYELMTVPVDVNNRISNFRAQSVNGLRVLETNPRLGSPFFRSHHNNFAPRIGFAWDVFGDGKTALRGGFGMFYDQVESEFRFFTANNVPFFGLSQVNNPPFPLGLSGSTGQIPLPAPDAIDFDLDVPARIQYSMNVQRQITANTVVNLGYVGSHSYHLTRQADQNTAVPQFQSDGTKFYLVPPPGGRMPPRKNPALGNTRFITSDANSFYHSLQADFSQRLSRGLRYKVSYAFAKNTDEASIVISQHARGNSTATMDPDNPKADRGLSAYDIRQNLVMNFTYDLPWTDRPGWAGRVGGWQLGTILTLTDGSPFTALTGFRRAFDQARSISDRPNLRQGASNNPVLGGPDRYFDAGAFELPPEGFYGNAGRNTIVAPGLVNVDFSLVKIISLGEARKLDFRAEFFNLFNRANFGLPDNILFNTNGSPRGAAGRISETVTFSRQIQFGLKFLF